MRRSSAPSQRSSNGLLPFTPPVKKELKLEFSKPHTYDRNDLPSPKDELMTKSSVNCHSLDTPPMKKQKIVLQLLRII